MFHLVVFTPFQMQDLPQCLKLWTTEITNYVSTKTLASVTRWVDYVFKFAYLQ